MSNCAKEEQRTAPPPEVLVTDVVKRDVDMSKMTVPEGCEFKGAKMPFYLRFTGGYGLHAGYVPNYPASHGCVRLPRVMAEHFFHNAQVGTPVIVHQ